MKEKFNFNPNAIYLKVKVSIGTPGIATTTIYKRGIGNATVKIAESPLESANIEEVNIGDTIEMDGKSLAIQTVIDYSAIGKNLWPQLIKKISSDYLIRDSEGTQKNFMHDADDVILSNDGKTVFIIKLISIYKGNQ